MKKKSVLYGMLSVILVFLVIEGTTGITTVLHHCSSHGESVLISGLLPSIESEDNCCSTSEPEEQVSTDCCEHNDSETGSNNESTYNSHCCNYEFSSLKIANYLPTLKFEIITPVVLTSFFTGTIAIVESEVPSYNEYTFSKPGGRGIIKSICTLIC